MNSIKVIRFSKKRQECSVKLDRISNEEVQKWTQCKDSSVIIQKLPEKLAKLAKKQTLGSIKHEEKDTSESFDNTNNGETFNESSIVIDFESEVTKELFKRQITSIDKVDFEEITNGKLETKIEKTESLSKCEMQKDNKFDQANSFEKNFDRGQTNIGNESNLVHKLKVSPALKRKHSDLQEINKKPPESKLSKYSFDVDGGKNQIKMPEFETPLPAKPKIKPKIEFEENKENVNPHIENQICANLQVSINENGKKFLMSFEKLDNNLESNIAIEQSDEDIEIIDYVHTGQMEVLKPKTTMISELETSVETKIKSNPNKYCGIDFNQQSWNKNLNFKNLSEDIEIFHESGNPEKSIEKSPEKFQKISLEKSKENSPSNSVISEIQPSTNVAKFFEDFYDLNETTDKQPLLRPQSEIVVKKLGLENFTEDYKIVHENKNPDKSDKICDNSIKDIKTQLSKNNLEVQNLKTSVKSVVHEEKKPIQCGICNAKFKGGLISEGIFNLVPSLKE